ncbi:MAG: hypothetical protein P4L40_14140 [Terracidiphilus sp.]|nr:hypothetical protein [Terracidiphilus sp.]
MPLCVRSIPVCFDRRITGPAASSLPVTIAKVFGGEVFAKAGSANWKEREEGLMQADIVLGSPSLRSDAGLVFEAGVCLCVLDCVCIYVYIFACVCVCVCVCSCVCVWDVCERLEGDGHSP